jgi:ATP-binding cassette, subfamily B, bacterial PglK
MNRDQWSTSTLARSIAILSRQDKRKVLVVMAIQVFMSILDLIGVAIIGVLGALAVSGVQSQTPGNRVLGLLSFLGIENRTFQEQAAILGVVATLILVSRTFASIFFTRRILFFLSRRSAVISSDLIAKLLSQPLLTIQARTTQETLFAVTNGVSVVTLGVIGVLVTMVSDLALLIVMAIGLLVVDPTIAISTLLVFALVGLTLFKFMHKRAHSLGSLDAELTIKSNEKVIEVLDSYRELVVRNRRFYYSDQIGKLRMDLSNTQAELAFMPNISKYVIETTLIFGALVISGAQFLLQDAGHAVATLAVFLAAGSRIAPAVLRLQQGSVSLRGNLASASRTLDMFSQFSPFDSISKVNEELDLTHEGFSATCTFDQVSFRYPNSSQPAINNISFSFSPGEIIAIVGPSGAGKTTLVDLLLGIVRPDTGSILISGSPPEDSISKWGGAVGYVPQSVSITTGSIRQNISLGFPDDSISEIDLRRLLQSCSIIGFC